MNFKQSAGEDVNAKRADAEEKPQGTMQEERLTEGQENSRVAAHSGKGDAIAGATVQAAGT
jgi:hypothetical protein